MILKGDLINTLEPYSFLTLFNFPYCKIVILEHSLLSSGHLTFFCRIKAPRAWRCASTPPYIFMAGN